MLECWHRSQHWLTSISAAIGSGHAVQRALQECCRSPQRLLTSISVTMTLEQAGQRVLQECWGSAGSWLTSISATIRSGQPGQRALQEGWRNFIWTKLSFCFGGLITLFQLFHTPCKVRKLSSHQRNSKKARSCTLLSPQISSSLSLSSVKVS